jgi:hypothetical protein
MKNPVLGLAWFLLYLSFSLSLSLSLSHPELVFAFICHLLCHENEQDGEERASSSSSSSSAAAAAEVNKICRGLQDERAFGNGNEYGFFQRSFKYDRRHIMNLRVMACCMCVAKTKRSKLVRCTCGSTRVLDQGQLE